jgi:hypothetical protein
MLNSVFSLFFGLVYLTANAQEYEQIKTFEVKPLEIEYSIILEDAELNYYEIDWRVPLIDSIAKAKGELPSTELHCYVYDSKGLIGFYKGLSTPMQYCGFQTKDSTIEVFFRRKRLHQAYFTKDSIEIKISAVNTNPFYKTAYRGPEFESVHLSVNSATNRKLTLLNDTNTVLISHGTRESQDAFGMPIHGFGYANVISLDRFYVNLKTGRIATGQKWINRKGIPKINERIDQFILVVPSIKYEDKNGHEYAGSDLIKAQKINLKKFNLTDFKTADKENYPY